MASTSHYDYHLFSGNEKIDVNVINSIIQNIDKNMYEAETFSTEEQKRAVDVENKVIADLDAEIKRATTADKVNASNISAEASRAKGIEQGLRDDVNALLDGTKVSGKATADAKGNVIDTYYAPMATVTKNINAEKTRATKAEGDLQTGLTEVTNAVSKLNSGESTEGSVAYQIAQIVNANNNGKIDTLKEIADWITNDKSGAAKMSTDISSLQTAVGKKANDTEISKVGKTGNYADLKGLPTLPEKVSDLNNDAGYVSKQYVDDAIENIPSPIVDYSDLKGLPTIPEKVSDLNNDADYISKKYVDDIAKNILVPNPTKEESALFVSRATDIDSLVKMKLVGGTIVWNQLMQNGNFSDGLTNWYKGTTTPSVNNGIVSVTRTADTLPYTYQNIQPIPENHVVCVVCELKVNQLAESADFANARIYLGGYGVGQMAFQLQNTDWNRYVKMNRTAPGDVFTYRIISASTEQTVQAKNIQLFDLTLMFGSEIADYVYSLERNEEGSGFKWLQSYGFFTKDYYGYDPGSLQSVCVSGRKLTDANGVVTNYPIDNVELRGRFKLDADNNLYVDGDIYHSNGQMNRKYGIVDLGTLIWSYQTIDGRTNYIANISKLGAKIINSWNTTSFISSKYDKGVPVSTSSDIDKVIGIIGGNVYIKDTSLGTNASEFTTAVSGIYLVYELASETTETVSPFVNPQRSVSGGTEEFIDGLTRDVMIPVGSISTHIENNLLKLSAEHADSIGEELRNRVGNGTTYGSVKLTDNDANINLDENSGYAVTPKAVAGIKAQVLNNRSMIAKNENVKVILDYSAGQQFIYGGHLCTALTDIPSGTRLVEGANYENSSDNIVNQLFNLNKKLDLVISFCRGEINEI